ncbi:MAG: phosphate ABC transporter substrate-binding protein [Anaerohalosphaeraceae bacterium]|nr:phosphate ABC transporter substrate-binding protein [Anaerohalosphaeraceae bacterium]
MKKTNRIAYVLVATIMLMASVSVFAEELRIDGSTTVGPIGDAFAEAFKNNYKGLDITVKKTGSGDGAAALIDGRCDVAMMSRFMKDKEFKAAVEKGIMPVAHVVAMDGVCVVVHPSNPVKALTAKQIRDIYTGKITNWKQLGGADMDVVIISRDTSSGTFETFHKLVMKKEEMCSATEYVSSNPQAHARVKTTTGAIGYVGIGFLDSAVRALEIDSIIPTKQSIASGRYPIARPLFLFTNGYPKPGTMVFKFCTFYLTETGQEIIEAKGFIPVTNY